MNRLFKYDLSAAIACILIPLVLYIGDGARQSISDYAYSDIDFIYVFLLTVAATLITTIGVRKNHILTWIMGIMLMAIPLTPHLILPTIHLVVSIIFFGGMGFHIIKYSDTFRKFRWFLVGLIVAAFGVYYTTDWISLFFAESIGLIVFGVNFLVDLIGDQKDEFDEYK